MVAAKRHPAGRPPNKPAALGTTNSTVGFSSSFNGNRRPVTSNSRARSTRRWHEHLAERHLAKAAQLARRRGNDGRRENRGRQDYCASGITDRPTINPRRRLCRRLGSRTATHLFGARRYYLEDHTCFDVAFASLRA